MSKSKSVKRAHPIVDIGHGLYGERPAHGLQAGVDYIEIETAEQLPAVADELAQDPAAAYADVQRNGREQAERFRASSVYPALVREAAEDVVTGGVRLGRG